MVVAKRASAKQTAAVNKEPAVKQDTKGKATKSNAGSDTSDDDESGYGSSSSSSEDSTEVLAFAKTISVTAKLTDAQIKEGAIFLKKYVAKEAAKTEDAVILNKKPTHPDTAKASLKDKPKEAI